MKKLLFPALALMLCIPTLSAQSRGDKYVGGIIGITTTSISIDGSSASHRFYYTPQLAVGFAFASTDGTSGYGFDAGLSLGAFEIRPSAHIGLSVSLLTLDYSYLSYSGTGVNGVSFQLGISPTVGFKYYF